jgi:hypothetical protein
MKRLKVGVVNTLSFIKDPSYVINDFDVTLEKVVGSQTFTFNNLQDLNSLDKCKDFILLNIDLLSNPVDGGEYYLTLSNGSTSHRFLSNVIDHSSDNQVGGVYSDTVIFNDL